MLPSAASSTSPPPPPFMQSPNAIPPRRSSTGHHQHQQQNRGAPASYLQPSPQIAPAPPSALASAPGTSSGPSDSRPQRHHHHSSSSSSNASPGNAMPTPSLQSVPESSWMNNVTATRRPRKPSITMASLAGGSAATFASGSATDALPSGLPTDPTRTLSTTAAAPPPPDPSRYATEDFNFTARHTWTQDKERIICGPFDYLNGTRGKEFRTQLISAFNGWLEVPEASLEVITRVVGMLHTASLLVDDVEDSSSLRRGMPVAHSIFGVPQTINSANYIYFLALQDLQSLRNPKALVVFAEELCNLHRGQGMDLFWRDTLTCPTEDDYLEMVGHKTGGLFRLGIKLMQAESRSLVDCVPLVNLLGLLFQIQDDYRNLLASEYSHNKGMCEDLTEGKFSFPIIHSIRSQPGNLQLLNILKQRTSNEEVKRYAVAHMEHTGSFAYTREVMSILTERARRLADALDEGKGRSAAIQAILDKLAI